MSQTASYTKRNVQFHRDGLYGVSRPAVNVKMLHLDLRRVNLPQEEGVVDGATVYTDVAFTHDWIDANLDEEKMDSVWMMACEEGWEMLSQEAKAIWGKQAEVISEGRSGGWAVVEGLKDYESWNVVDLSKWRRFEQYARAVVKDIPRQMVMGVYLNYFQMPVVEV